MLQIIVKIFKKVALTDYSVPIAIFLITLLFFWIKIFSWLVNFVNISSTNTVNFNHAGILWQCWWIFFIHFWQITIFFETLIQIYCHFVWKIDSWEIFTFRSQENMMSILIELIRAFRIICTGIKLCLAWLLKTVFNAFIDCYSLHDLNQNENEQYLP